MTFRKALVAIPAGAMLAAAAIAPVATSAHSVSKHAKHAKHVKHHAKHAKHAKHHAKKNQSRVQTNNGSGGNINCNGVAPATVPYDLTVPRGATCTINGSKIGHDVNVNSGATLIDNAGTIGHDISANYPKAMGITGTPSSMGSVGNDIYIYGTSGATSSGRNYICDTSVKNNASVYNSTSTAGPWFIGDNDEQCGPNGGNAIGENLTVEYNQDKVDISDNEKGGSSDMFGIEMNLTVTGNLVTATTPVVESNFVAGNATCQRGTTKDADGTMNIVDGTNNGCH